MESRHGVSNIVFASVTVVLLVVAASGFLLTNTGMGSSTKTMTETMTHFATSTTETMMNETIQHAVAFVPAHGQMISGGWLIVASLGNGSYAVAVHAQGLEPPSMGDYIVEAAQNTGQMAMVPIGGTTTNVTLSEFTTDAHGTGQFFIILHQNPSSVYENVSIVFLPGMQMQNATVVATAPLTMMSNSSSTSSSSTHT